MTEQQSGMDQIQDTVKLDVGGVLREARESMGMSVEDVAGRLKFAPRQIVALENGNFEQLPEMAFVRGFVRSYAKLMQLDAAPLLDALPGVPAQSILPERKSREDFIPNVSSARNQNILWLAGALVVALVIGITVWQHDGGPVEPKHAADAKTGDAVASAVTAVSIPSEAPASAVPDIAPKNAASTAASVDKKVADPKVAAQKAARKHVANAMLKLAFDEDSWVEVKDGEGKILLSYMGLSGSEQGVNGTPPFAVTIGNAKGVRLFYKGAPVDLAPHTEVDVAHLKLE